MDRLGKKIKICEKDGFNAGATCRKIGRILSSRLEMGNRRGFTRHFHASVLANFFNVTTDELLGVDLSKNKKNRRNLVRIHALEELR